MKTRTLAGALALALIAAALKLAFFPSIKDAYFTMDNRELTQAPAGLVVVRPTHYPFLRRNGILYARVPSEGTNSLRIMGRNVPLRDALAAAYGENPARVLLPPDAPKDNFDFLVTAASDARQQFQSVIRRKLGYVAQKETRDADVLALKITDPRLPGLTASGADEKPFVHYDDRRLILRHLPLMLVAEERLMPLTTALGRYLNIPVVDKTGLTNAYNYSIAWNVHVQRQLRDETTARAAADKMLQGMGLGLAPDTAPLEMLVVKKAD
jgi:uncharacterized protein (TIGR03435 family)